MRRVATGQPEQNARALRNLQLTDAREFSVDASAGTKRVHHGLGRVPKGWLVVDVFNDSNRIRVWRTAWTSEYVDFAFDGSSNAVFKVWIF